jgi:hypothetical protein
VDEGLSDEFQKSSEVAGQGGLWRSGQLVSRAGEHAARHSWERRRGLAWVSEGRAWIVEGFVEGFVATIAMADSVRATLLRLLWLLIPVRSLSARRIASKF